MMIDIFQVDAFTDEPFKGNPAAVCLLAEPKSEEWMQSVAMEMNLSETAFLLKEGDGFRLRWFTPSMEIDLCGHATLASAHTLWENGYLDKAEEARFYTKSGLLTAKYEDGWLELNFPAAVEEACNIPEGLKEALGVQPIYSGRSGKNYLVEVESEEVVRRLSPNFTRLLDIDMHGVIVTSRSSSKDYDFISRFFAPEIGIFEDPVTGSAHCCLAPYWSSKLGKTSFNAYQASERGGFLKVVLDGDRVNLKGQAVTVLRGKLY
ncbi:MAG: PhzF family phenazine biosynthesis protein [Bacillota bacterium]|nr:PhzF family phenazine biosynthesis protein [Bacillota bacterium]